MDHTTGNAGIGFKRLDICYWGGDSTLTASSLQRGSVPQRSEDKSVLTRTGSSIIASWVCVPVLNTQPHETFFTTDIKIRDGAYYNSGTRVVLEYHMYEKYGHLCSRVHVYIA